MKSTNRDLFLLEDYDEIQEKFEYKSQRILYLRFEKEYSEIEISNFLGLRRQHVNNVCRESNVKEIHSKRLLEYRKNKNKVKK